MQPYNRRQVVILHFQVASPVFFCYYRLRFALFDVGALSSLSSLVFVVVVVVKGQQKKNQEEKRREGG